MKVFSFTKVVDMSSLLLKELNIDLIKTLGEMWTGEKYRNFSTPAGKVSVIPLIDLVDYMEQKYPAIQFEEHKVLDDIIQYSEKKVIFSYEELDLDTELYELNTVIAPIIPAVVHIVDENQPTYFIELKGLPLLFDTGYLDGARMKVKEEE